MKKILLSIVFVFLIGSLLAYVVMRRPDGKFAVVELFTSEGCSSCPPADKLLGQLNKDLGSQHVYVLSFHVDYWDKYGWKDKFSNPQFTSRQMAYDKTLHTDTYTPQAVVNGTKEALGSDKNALMQFINSMLHTTDNGKNLKCDLTINGGKLQVAYQADPSQTGDNINVALVQDNASDQVTAGENKGVEIQHFNVVREFKTEKLKNTAGDITLDIPEDMKAGKLHVIAYVQNRKNLQISSAISADTN
ncbi:MAG: DUF1223 domain-containing protein [Sphingobacteriales bacterium]